MIRALLIASGCGIAATYALTRKLDAVPRDTLLALKKEQLSRTFPESQLPFDTFELRVPRRLLGPPSRRITISEAASSFGHSPVFALERWLIFNAGLADNVAVPHSFDQGNKMAIWTVEARAHNQLLLSWSAKGAPFSGSTFLSVGETEDGASAVIRFGSGLNVPKGRDVSQVSLNLHYFYSRVLLVNTAAVMVFRGLTAP
ncbi:hypothetical protein BCR33DRAFT_780588 [Rhizoclosmatium globosum]|uniref:Uncharacterized protein n=1 Tax=Rhizoclosmatium globosum TaxID=329046 RepID=A0A1Y2CX93_9FUNG|nr:hypothetical protein BCR33DRAFT_780588 [Rhizoclosmatium globosum]|eukprot:ORY51640.1 hypothetical protein BCR33DRAFT_780588 [Rhizoclosmatium globosum]